MWLWRVKIPTGDLNDVNLAKEEIDDGDEGDEDD